MDTFIVFVETGDGHPSIEVVGPFADRVSADVFLENSRQEPIDGGYRDAVIINAETATSPEKHQAEEAELA